jgi:hypothetical protein
MSISLSSARRLAVSAVGAGAVAGAMLFGATPAANAAPAPAPQMIGLAHVAPAAWHPQPAYGGRGFDHGGFGPGGFDRGHGGFGPGGFDRGHGGFGPGGFDRGHGGFDHRGFDHRGFGGRGFGGPRGWW